MTDFPTLQPDSADFKEEVAYDVKANDKHGKLIITHSLTGESFIKQLIDEGKARFAVSLLYRDSAQRKHRVFEGGPVPVENQIIAEQVIPNEFTYAPEIRANIITIEDVKITADERSGLDSFWRSRSQIDIPRQTRIASYPDLIFNDGNMSSIISIRENKKFTKGTLKVTVNKIAGINEEVIKVLCAKDIYRQLRKTGIRTLDNPKDEKDAMRLALVTQILSAAYGEVIKGREEGREEEEITNGSLIEHLNELKEETGQDWEDQDFNPSLAATEMLPYQLQVLRGDEENG